MVTRIERGLIVVGLIIITCVVSINIAHLAQEQRARKVTVSKKRHLGVEAFAAEQRKATAAAQRKTNAQAKKTQTMIAETIKRVGITKIDTRPKPDGAGGVSFSPRIWLTTGEVVEFRVSETHNEDASYGVYMCLGEP